MSCTRGETGAGFRHSPEGRVNTVYGVLGIRKRRCSCCQQVKNQSEFYHENKKYSKHTQKTHKKPQPTCAVCNDKIRKTNKAIKYEKKKGIFVDKSLHPIPTLNQFVL